MLPQERERETKKKKLSKRKGIGEKDRQKHVAKKQTAKNCKKHQKQKFITVYIKKFTLKSLY